MLLKALLAVAILLVVTESCYGKKKLKSDAEINELVHKRFSEALANSAKRRLADHLSTKGAPLVRALVERASSDRYVRDFYKDLMGTSQKDTEEFLEDYCGADLDKDKATAPIEANEIAKESDEIAKYLSKVEDQLKPLYALLEAGPDETLTGEDDLIYGFLEQNNGFDRDGACSLYTLVLGLIRMIENGLNSDSFSHHEYCYNTAWTLETVMGEYGGELEAVGEAMANGDMTLPQSIGQAVRADINCLRLKLQDLFRRLRQGQEMNGDRTEGEAWDFSVNVIHEMYAVISQYTTLKETVTAFNEGREQLGYGVENKKKKKSETRDLLELLEKLLEKKN